MRASRQLALGGLAVVFGSVDKEPFLSKIQRDGGPSDPRSQDIVIHSMAFVLCAARAETHLKRYNHNEIAMLIAEDRDLVRKYLKQMFAIFKHDLPQLKDIASE